MVVESVIGESNTSSYGKALDIVMLAMTGGRERTVDEYAALFAASGFRLNKTVAVSEALMVMEAFAA